MPEEDTNIMNSESKQALVLLLGIIKNDISTGYMSNIENPLWSSSEGTTPAHNSLFDKNESDTHLFPDLQLFKVWNNFGIEPGNEELMDAIIIHASHIDLSAYPEVLMHQLSGFRFSVFQSIDASIKMAQNNDPEFQPFFKLPKGAKASTQGTYNSGNTFETILARKVEKINLMGLDTRPNDSAHQNNQDGPMPVAG